MSPGSAPTDIPVHPLTSRPQTVSRLYHIALSIAEAPLGLVLQFIRDGVYSGVDLRINNTIVLVACLLSGEGVVFTGDGCTAVVAVRCRR